MHRVPENQGRQGKSEDSMGQFPRRPSFYQHLLPGPVGNMMELWALRRWVELGPGLMVSPNYQLTRTVVRMCPESVKNASCGLTKIYDVSKRDYCGAKGIRGGI